MEFFLNIICITYLGRIYFIYYIIGGILPKILLYCIYMYYIPKHIYLRKTPNIIKYIYKTCILYYIYLGRIPIKIPTTMGENVSFSQKIH